MKPQEMDMTIKQNPAVNVPGIQHMAVIDAVATTQDRQNLRAPKCPRLVANHIVTS